MELKKSKVYVKTDERGLITRCEGGYTTPASLKEWMQIDEGTGDKYNLCQSHYFDGGLYTVDCISRYKLTDGKPVERTKEEIEADRAKIQKTVSAIDTLLDLTADHEYQLSMLSLTM